MDMVQYISAQVLLFSYRPWPALVFLKWTGEVEGEDMKKQNKF